MAADLLSAANRHLAELYRPLRKFAFRVGAVFLVSYAALTLFPVTAAEWHRGMNFDGWFGDSASAHALRWLEAYLIPRGETILVLGPFEAFTVLMWVGAFLAALVTVPYASALAVRFAWTGFRRREQALIRWLMAGVPMLFSAGTLLALWVLPTLYLWSYGLAPAVGSAPTVSLTQFVVTTAVFAASVGAIFEAPAMAAGLAYAGVLKSAMLRKHWRAAVVTCAIVPLFITTGAGGGVIEIPLFFVLLGLYALTYAVVRRVEKGASVRARRHDAAETA